MGSSWTPGRVNLIGEWIDFNGGWVLPAALPLGVSITVEATDSHEDHVRSAQFEGEAAAALDAPASGHWADYIFGALQSARAEGWLETGANVTLSSDIPAGAGVSSSAAVTVGALKAMSPEGVDLTEIAKLARKVENDFIGVPCGIMDQMAVAHTGPGETLALDTLTLDFEAVALPAGWRFAVLHSGVERALADGRYGERRDACLQAADALGVEWLCQGGDIDQLTPSLQPIARHAITENERTRAAIQAMHRGDSSQFGALMTASHESLRDDFAVSTPEVDALVEDAVRFGALGARMTGAGFGGCIVALLPEGPGQSWFDQLLMAHPRARRVCEIGAGTI